MRITRRATVAALLAMPIACSAPAGELDPPTGPVAPTMKDLEDVEPRAVLRNDFDNLTPIVISAPGSYKLGEDIQALPSQHGVEIRVNDVTLDLNGFTIRGNGEVGSLDGIHISGDRFNIAIHNGTVRDFFGMGINGDTEDNMRVQNVRAFNNGATGIRTGQSAVVTGCSAWNNAGNGIRVSHNSMIQGCSAYENSDDGFSAAVSVSISDCAAWGNSAEGFDTANGCTIMNCASRDNGLNGFDSAQRSTYLNCAAVGNGMHGFNSINAATYLNCSAALNTMNGFEVDNGLIRGCVANSNDGVNYNPTGGTQVIESHP